MKYKILILSRRMDIGGVEVSLINFLRSFDPKRYEVELMLTEYEGKLKSHIPEWIKVKEFQFNEDVYLHMLNFDTASTFVGRVKQAYIKKKGENKYRNTGNPYLYTILEGMKSETEKYDLVVDFHGYGYISTIFMCNKVLAKKKAIFIHDENMAWIQNFRAEQNKIDYFFCVSQACADNLKRELPQVEDRIYRFDNIISIEEIRARAEEKQDDIKKGNKPSIISIGRLEEQKGFDVAICTADILKKRNYEFNWYIVGDGSLYSRLERMIEERNLKGYVMLLGKKENPYPLLKAADIYVQPSRHEGFGIAVCEAKIMKKPIVATDLPCIAEQIQSGKNGILVPFDEEAFADAIGRLLNDLSLRQFYINNIEEYKNNEERGMKLIDSICEEIEEEKK